MIRDDQAHFKLQPLIPNKWNISRSMQIMNNLIISKIQYHKFSSVFFCLFHSSTSVFHTQLGAFILLLLLSISAYSTVQIKISEVQSGLGESLFQECHKLIGSIAPICWFQITAWKHIRDPYAGFVTFREDSVPEISHFNSIEVPIFSLDQTPISK